MHVSCCPFEAMIAGAVEFNYCDLIEWIAGVSGEIADHMANSAEWEDRIVR